MRRSRGNQQTSHRGQNNHSFQSGYEGWREPMERARYSEGRESEEQFGDERYQAEDYSHSRRGAGEYPSQQEWARRTRGSSFAGLGPQGYKRSDERITEDVNEALTRDPDLDPTNVQVEVQNGEVTLKGTVSDRASKRQAEDIAESCSGVREVQNQLRVKREDERDGEDQRYRQQMAS